MRLNVYLHHSFVPALDFRIQVVGNIHENLINGVWENILGRQVL